MRVFPPSPELDWLKDLIVRHQDQFVDCGTDSLDLDMLWSVSISSCCGSVGCERPRRTARNIWWPMVTPFVPRGRMTGAVDRCRKKVAQMAEIGYAELKAKGKK